MLHRGRALFTNTLSLSLVRTQAYRTEPKMSQVGKNPTYESETDRIDATLVLENSSVYIHIEQQLKPFEIGKTKTLYILTVQRRIGVIADNRHRRITLDKTGLQSLETTLNYRDLYNEGVFESEEEIIKTGWTFYCTKLKRENGIYYLTYGRADNP
jgi:hypothetical protein